MNYNCVKKFTDNQFIDYLLVVDKKNMFIFIYNIIDLQVVLKGDLNDNYPIDFILSKTSLVPVDSSLTQHSPHIGT